MAYQTGVTSSLADLITTLQSFADANGFDLGPSGTYTGTAIDGASKTFNIVSLVKNGIYYLFAQPTTGTVYLWMNSAGSYTGGTGANWTNIHTHWCRTDNLAGPHVGYHFFGDGNCVNTVVEIVTNVFVHFSFGELTKNGAYAGGQYVTGQGVVGITPPGDLNNLFNEYNYIPFGAGDVGSQGTNYASISGHIRTPISGPTAAIQRIVNPTTTWNTGMAATVGRPMLQVSPNTMNGRAVLVPIAFVQSSSLGVGPYYQLGFVGNARMVNIANLQPKETVNTDWMVFPISQKNGPATVYMNSGNYGIAYKK